MPICLTGPHGLALLLALALVVGGLTAPAHAVGGYSATNAGFAAPPTPAAAQTVAQEPTVEPAVSPTPARGFGRRPRPTPPPLPRWIALAGVVGVTTTLALVYLGRRRQR